MNCLNFGQVLNYKKRQIIRMAEQFEWRLFAVVVTYQQQGNYAVTYHHWPHAQVKPSKIGLPIRKYTCPICGFTCPICALLKPIFWRELTTYRFFFFYE